MEEEEKRLFFGAEVHAAWPKELPEGRILDESARHITLAFLGATSFPALHALLPTIPKPAFRFGLVGKCDKLLFLPKHHARVVAGHVTLLSEQDALKNYQKSLHDWLKEHNYPIDEREFLPHVTIARAPFALREWEKIQEEFPLFVSAVHLYESVGNLTYVPRWSHALLAPFEEFEHTADIAFRIQGENLPQLYLHAQMALAFKYPPLLEYVQPELKENSLDQIIISLNDLVAEADQEIGAPFKAVSFHGKLIQKDPQTLMWEMIVDV